MLANSLPSEITSPNQITMRIRVKFLLVFLALAVEAMAKEAPVEILATLLSPVKIDTLKGDRAANSRLRKIVYWIEIARSSGDDPASIVLQAQRAAGYEGTPRADADRRALLHNRTILERLGCLDGAGMANLRRGKAPLITLGNHSGDIASVDHIIPRALCPELDERLYNLEFVPARVNAKKAAAVGDRQRQLAMRWHALGLLSADGLRAVTAGGYAGG